MSKEFTLDNWENYFPEAKPREVQRQIMEYFRKNWNKFDNFLLNAPTGCGKSAIALCLARTLASQVDHPYERDEPQPGHTYITTTSIELQNQYEASYAKLGLRKIYSASNFKCTRSYPMNCKEGKVICGQLKTPCPQACPYDIAKGQFIRDGYGVMNITYYLYETHYAKMLPKRGLMIFDEGHNVGNFVKDFVTVNITEYSVRRHNVTFPKPSYDKVYKIEDLKKWIFNEYLKAIEKEMLHLAQQRDAWKGSFENKEYLKIIRELEDHTSQCIKISELFKVLNPIDWVAEKVDDKITITPISPKSFMKEKLVSKNMKNIFMSATLFDKKFTEEEYDLDPAKTAYYTTPSPFPIENRPIYVLPVGKLEYGNIEKSMKPFAETMVDILDGHKNERGIVFVSSYAQANELIRQVNSPRLITHLNSKDKAEMMELHKSSKDTFLVSPSSHEGLDLKGDLSTVQVILKMPFMSLGSYSIKRRCELYPEWYNYQTALTLVQASGRSIRSDTDKAVTYILDSNFQWWSKKWSKFLPPYWLNSIIKP
jgi:Rad3-related DNA helicase